MGRGVVEAARNPSRHGPISAARVADRVRQPCGLAGLDAGSLLCGGLLPAVSGRYCDVSILGCMPDWQ
eukprot:scaffold99998_cov41-Prasinocladus_malaysianus.AAC.1